MRRRWIALLLVVLGALWFATYIANFTGEGPFGGPTMAKDWGPSPPTGWTRHEAADGSLAVWLPPNWRTADIGAQLRGIDVFGASGPTVSAEPSTILRVTRYQLQRKWTLDGLRQAAHANLRDNASVRGEIRSWLQLIAGRAASVLRFDYEVVGNGRVTRMSKLEYAFLVGGSSYVLGFRSEAGAIDRIRDTLDQIASSFRPQG